MRDMTVWAKSHSRELLLLVVIVLIGIFVTCINPTFASVKNLLTVLNSYAIMGIMAIGMMMVIVTGNIDVSVGAQFAVCGMVAAVVAERTQGKYSLVIFFVAIITGVLLGLFNGFFVAKLNIPAIIVTLATLSILKGSLILITDGVWVEQLSGPFTKVATTKFAGISVLLLCWLLVLIIAWFLINKTRMGRGIMAVGGNPAGAMRIGINRFGIYLFSFGFMGATSGLAAALNISKLTMAHPTAGAGMEMKLIAAAVIGGTLFQGGSASVFGTFLGILLFAVIENALVLMKVPVYWQALVTGLVLLLAIASSAKREKSLLASLKKAKEAGR